MINLSSSYATWLQRAASLLLAVVIFIIDSLTPLDIAIAVLYVIVILVATNTYSRRGVIAIFVICITLTLTAFLLAHGDELFSSSFARCLVSMAAISIATVLVLKNKLASDDLQEQVRLLAQTHDAIIVCHMDGRIKSWNKGAEYLYGWDSHEVIGKNCLNLLKTDAMVNIEEAKRQLENGDFWEGIFNEKRKDGSAVVVTSRWSLYRNEYGKPVAIMASNNDITKQQQAFEKLRRSEEFLASAQQLSQTGSIGIHYPSGLLYWSDEAKRIYQYPEDIAPNLTLLLNRSHPDDKEKTLQIFKDCELGKDSINATVRLLLPFQQLKYIKILLQKKSIDPGNFEYIGAVMDITSTTLAEDALHQSQMELAHISRVTMLGELVASFAHEVNQPLASINTNGEAVLRWINRSPPDIDEVCQGVQRMIRDAIRASNVVKHIRAMVRKDPPQHNIIVLNDLIIDTLTLLEREINRSRIELNIQLTSTSLLISGDKIQLQQVLLNLIMNAIQAMAQITSSHHELTLSNELIDDEVHIKILDTGPGIKQADLPRLFDAFYTTKSEGMGMGLSICRSIIEAHNGRISVENLASGGAQLLITLPIYIEDSL